MQIRKSPIIFSFVAAIMVIASFIAPAAQAMPDGSQITELRPAATQYGLSKTQLNGIVVDSAMTREQALGDNVVPAEGQAIHAKIKDDLRVVPVVYHGYDNRIHAGQIVVHKALVLDTYKVFLKMFQLRFPIKSVIPQSAFGYSDQLSMRANNSSNYRPEPGSEHRKGSAFDLNPMQNPFDITAYDPTEPVQPAGATYNPAAKGTVVMNSPMRQYWASLNWEWGGNWGNPNADPAIDFFRVGYFDYQHFQLNINRYDQFEALLPDGI